jgi:hypothetical protein
MISDCERLRGFCSRNAFSKPIAMMLPTLRIITTTTVGAIPGRSMCQIFCRRLAPSRRAASYRLGSMPASAAMKMIAEYPAVCQTPLQT